MIRNYILTTFILLCTGILVSAQPHDILKEITEAPGRAGGVYYAYPVTADSMAPMPEGYQPVYHSHYGRHGSRWIINKAIYPTLLNVMAEQRENGNLTPLGEDIERQVALGARHAEGHLGELSPLGERQHKAIADRMYTRFASLFDAPHAIEARSSTEPRCIVSMAAFCEQLKQRQPNMTINRHATPGDMRFMSPRNAKTAAYGSDTIAWRRAFMDTRDSLTTSLDVASKLFVDPNKIDDLPEFMRFLSDVALSVQDLDGLDIDILSIFSPRALADQWKSSNYIMFVRNAESAIGHSYGPEAGKPLLEDIVAHADSALAGNGPLVDLRFGHDTALLKLLALSGITPDEPVDSIDDSSPDAVAPYWQTYTLSPMGANLQLTFVRNAAGDILAAPRLNEQPAYIKGITPVYPGYYSWPALRALWLSKL